MNRVLIEWHKPGDDIRWYLSHWALFSVMGLAHVSILSCCQWNLALHNRNCAGHDLTWWRGWTYWILWVALHHLNSSWIEHNWCHDRSNHKLLSPCWHLWTQWLINCITSWQLCGLFDHLRCRAIFDIDFWRQLINLCFVVLLLTFISEIREDISMTISRDVPILWDH